MASTDPFEQQLRMGQYASANVIWRISDLFSTGVEYLYVSRLTEGGERLHNNRVYGMLMMTF